jgi:hypothetical protein
MLDHTPTMNYVTLMTSHNTEGPKGAMLDHTPTMNSVTQTEGPKGVLGDALVLLQSYLSTSNIKQTDIDITNQQNSRRTEMPPDCEIAPINKPLDEGATVNTSTLAPPDD